MMFPPVEAGKEPTESLYENPQGHFGYVSVREEGKDKKIHVKWGESMNKPGKYEMDDHRLRGFAQLFSRWDGCVVRPTAAAADLMRRNADADGEIIVERTDMTLQAGHDCALHAMAAVLQEIGVLPRARADALPGMLVEQSWRRLLMAAQLMGHVECTVLGFFPEEVQPQSQRPVRTSRRCPVAPRSQPDMIIKL